VYTKLHIGGNNGRWRRVSNSVRELEQARPNSLNSLNRRTDIVA